MLSTSEFATILLKYLSDFMIGSKKVSCIIPARLASTRFPKKILAELGGKPLIQWVWEAANRVHIFDEVLFAIDEEETAQVIESFGGRFLMTSKECVSGTERLVELWKKNLVKSDLWVGWQADEPFITSIMIEDLLQSCEEDECGIWTLCKKIDNSLEIQSPHVVKVVRNFLNEALYFSRSPIPFVRDKGVNQSFYKHVGMYAFSSEALEKISTLPLCAIEEMEKLEQLRFLNYGLKIKVHQTEDEIFSIDIPEHLATAEKFLQQLRT